jgi:hypothetical protein
VIGKDLGEAALPVTESLLGGSQCLRALQRANEVRLARAGLKRGIAEGTISATDVILSPASEIRGMTVGDLLLSQRRWGRTRCRTLLATVPLSETKTVGSMTDRQRNALAALLAGATAPVLTEPWRSQAQVPGGA